MPIDFQAIFNLSPNPYCLLDRQLRYVAANQAYLHVTASRLEDLLGRHVFDAFPNDPADPNNLPAAQLRQSFERVLATGERDVLALIRYRVPRHTGQGPIIEDRYWSATHTPLLDERGEVAFILQHTTDVTELQQLKQAVQESHPHKAISVQLEAGVLHRAQVVQETNHTLDAERRHLRRLFEQAPGFVAILRGPQHVFELANNAYYQLTGTRELMGKPIREALPELQGQGYFELLDRVFASAEPFVGRAMDAKLQREPGGPLEQVFVDFVYQPVIEPDGRVAGIFVQGQDVTDKKLAEQERSQLLAREQAARAEAERANRLKDEFLATVSHELRTPLTAMLGWVQMLRTGVLPENRRQRALETVERNARAQSQLIEDLLDVSRIMAGKLTLAVEPVEVAGVVEAALESVRPAAQAKDIRLQPVLDSSAQVMGDAVRLQQIVWNLLANAVKFTPKGGRVQVVVERRDSSVELTVADTGQGISADFLPHVFERFRQAEGSTTRQHGGLGLGLAIVKHLVELHGATVWATSEGKGRGAVFTVRLPQAVIRRVELSLSGVAPPAEASGLAGDYVCPLELAGLRVLVVDDEQDTRELLRVLLERCGVKVLAVGSAAEALELFHEMRPDILVSDIGMPGEDGYSLIRKVRALSPEEGGRTPAVALTAYTRAEDRTRALLAGFKAHVPKPIEPGELVAVLSSLVPNPGR